MPLGAACDFLVSAWVPGLGGAGAFGAGDLGGGGAGTDRGLAALGFGFSLSLRAGQNERSACLKLLHSRAVATPTQSLKKRPC